jgi:Cys-rich protein (TIGR01571 family)
MCDRCLTRCIDNVDSSLSVLHGLPDTLRPPGAWLSKLSDASGAPGGEGRCVYVHLCWCLAAGDVAARVPHNPPEARLLDCLCGGLLGCAVCTYCMCWGVTRTRLRHQHNIPGNSFVDHIITLLFPTCYLSQALNHLDLAQGAKYAVPPSGLAARAPVQVVMAR